ncbi:MAG: DUF4389 domain-containing protein [Chloroflexota bacterium]
MSGWGSGSGGTDPWGRPTTGSSGGQGGQGPGYPPAPGQPGAPGGSGGWQTQSAPGGTPGAGQPSGWQTQTGGQPGYAPRPGTPPQPGWGPPPGQQPPPGWGQQPPPPGYARPPQPGQMPPGQQPPPGWGPPPGQQPPPGWGQPQPGPVPTWAQPPQGAAPPSWNRPPQGAAGGPPVAYGQQPPAGYGQPAWGVPGSPDPDAFPVRLIYDETQGIGRFWGLLWLGMLVRMILLIPHFIVLYFVAIVAGLLAIFSWVPVLIQGRQAGIMYTFIGGYQRWSVRILSYLILMNSGYPPFSLSGEDDYRVRLEIDEGQRVNRFWGIPIIGILLRSIILIPHYIVLAILGIAAYILIFFAWVPVLFLGRQSELVYSVVGGWLRWTIRVSTYLFLLHDHYPPFSLGNEEADRYRG